MGQHVFYPRRFQRCHYLLLPPISLQILQVDVQVPRHQQFSTPGALLEFCDNTFIVEVSLGARLHLMMYHHLSVIAS